VTQVLSVRDREALARLVASGQHVTVVGSSWKATEVAAYLNAVAKKHGWGSAVTMIFPEPAPLVKQVRGWMEREIIDSWLWCWDR
jgi:hypothetical protein